MNLVKAFIAGIVIPSLLLPAGLYYAFFSGHREILEFPSVHLLPLVWGIWNALYFASFKHFFLDHENRGLWITGAVLGLLVACYGIFYLHIAFFGHPHVHYIPLVLAPIVYGILWRFGVKPLNHLLGIEK